MVVKMGHEARIIETIGEATMNPLLNQADEFIKLAIRMEKRGMYFLAHTRYTQAWTTLVNLVLLRDSGAMSLSVQEEGRLAVIYQLLAVRLQGLSAKMGNGHKMSGREHDYPGAAVKVLLEEVLAGF